MLFYPSLDSIALELKDLPWGWCSFVEPRFHSSDAQGFALQQLQAASLTAWVDGAAAVAAGIAIVNVRKRVLLFWFLPSGQIDQFVTHSNIKDLGK